MMDKKKAKQFADFAFKDIFNRENPFSLDEMEERFAFGLILPKKEKDSLTGNDVWLTRKTTDKVMQWGGWDKQDKNGTGTVREGAGIKNMDDLIGSWNKIMYNLAGRSANAIDCIESDSVYDSNELYRCSKAVKSQKCLFCNDIVNDRYCIALTYAWNSTSVIRAVDSRAPLSQSFALNWCGRVSRSMYLSNCMDMYECMFCANLRGKRYCIANMQFTKEEYMPIKEMVIDWTIDNFGPKKSVLF